MVRAEPTVLRPNRASRRKKVADKIKLDIACGQRKQDGFIGIDISPSVGADIVHDLTQTPWPIESDSVAQAFCSHFVEHLNGDQMMAFMDELYRVMTAGAQCLIIAPYYTSMRAVQDPTHRQFISEANFLYYNKEWRTTNGLDHYPIHCDFDFSYGYGFAPDIAGRNEEFRGYALRHYWNAVHDLHVTVTRK